MRCPYCNGLNAERATFCAHCGRDITQSARIAQPAQQPPSTRSQSYPQQQPSSAQRTPAPSASTTPSTYPMQPQPARTSQSRPTTSSPTQTARPVSALGATQTVRTSGTMKAPEPPTQFPPRTIEQLQALEQGALTYTLVNEAVGDGRKRIVRISYAACSAWQQVATLLKAFKEQPSDKFDSIIVQGIVSSTVIPYTFNNGQLRFDRDVRLGSQLINRYIIETGTGLENDSVRIVLQDTKV